MENPFLQAYLQRQQYWANAREREKDRQIERDRLALTDKHQQAQMEMEKGFRQQMLDAEKARIGIEQQRAKTYDDFMAAQRKREEDQTNLAVAKDKAAGLLEDATVPSINMPFGPGRTIATGPSVDPRAVTLNGNPYLVASPEQQQQRKMAEARAQAEFAQKTFAPLAKQMFPDDEDAQRQITSKMMFGVAVGKRSPQDVVNDQLINDLRAGKRSMQDTIKLMHGYNPAQEALAGAQTANIYDQMKMRKLEIAADRAVGLAMNRAAAGGAKQGDADFHNKVADHLGQMLTSKQIDPDTYGTAIGNLRKDIVMNRTQGGGGSIIGQLLSGEASVVPGPNAKPTTRLPARVTKPAPKAAATQPGAPQSQVPFYSLGRLPGDFLRSLFQ